MKIKTDTKLFFSISTFPSNKGSNLHNFLFKLFSINAIYIPLAIKNLNSFLIFAKDIKASGFSVSMPYKKKIIKFLDKKSKEVLLTNSCNTVLIKNSKFYGYNTDYLAVEKILKKYRGFCNKEVQVLGHGATCKTVLIVLKKLGFKKISVYARNKKKKSKQKIKFVNWKKRNENISKILINTTPIGMNISKIDKTPISYENIKLKKIIIDFPIAKRNIPALQKKSKKFEIKYHSGNEIHLYQGIKQAQIYLNKKIGYKIYNMVKEKLY